MSLLQKGTDTKERKSEKAVADLLVNLIIIKNRAEDVPYEKNGLQDCLEQSHCRHNKIDETVIRVEVGTYCYSAELK